MYTHHINDNRIKMLNRLIVLLFLYSLLSGANGLSSIHRRDSKRKLNNGRRRNRQSSSSSSSPPQSSKTERTVVILYHKPPNTVVSHVAEDSRPTVYDEIQSMRGFIPSKTKDSSPPISFQEATRIYSKLHAIGRLDADTSGLLLLTNDGGLLHHVTNPNARSSSSSSGNTSFKEQTKKLITKTYQALIMGYHTDESLQSIRGGVDIGKKYGGMTKPVHELQILDHPNHKSTVVSLTISEGKNRQVRRMFHSIGSGVMKLQRTKIGEDLTLDGVSEGQWKILSDEEVEQSLNWKPRDIIVEDQTFRTGSTRKRRPRQY